MREGAGQARADLQKNNTRYPSIEFQEQQSRQRPAGVACCAVGCWARPRPQAHPRRVVLHSTASPRRMRPYESAVQCAAEGPCNRGEARGFRASLGGAWHANPVCSPCLSDHRQAELVTARPLVMAGGKGRDMQDGGGRESRQGAEEAAGRPGQECARVPLGCPPVITT